MTYQIKLTQVPGNDVALLKNALNHHVGTLQFLLETMEEKVYAKDLSIAVELWYELNKRTAVQHPVQASRIKLSIHKAFILLDAIKEYNRNGSNDYDKARCNRYYLAIDKQLPTYTQLAIQQNY